MRLRHHPSARIPVSIAFALALLATLSAQPVNPHAGETIGTAQQVYDGALLPDIQVNTFRNTERLFATRPVRHGSTIYPLPRGTKTLVPSASHPEANSTTSTTTCP